MRAEKATELFRKKRQSLGEGKSVVTQEARLLVVAAAYEEHAARAAVASEAAASTLAGRAFAGDGVQHCRL